MTELRVDDWREAMAEAVAREYGGAYLSIGTALGWRDPPGVEEWAIYPGAAERRAKLDDETPRWKWPFWLWVKLFGGWPASAETLSSKFDFNRAPFFQSFVEARVEPSVGRVVIALHGVDGKLRRRDLQTGGRGRRAGGDAD